ncbi:hypothetical protein, partial [Streptomyces sp. NPDC004976]
EALPSCPQSTAITRTRLPFDTHPSRSKRQQLLNLLKIPEGTAISLSLVTADNDDVRNVLANDVHRLASDYLQDGLRSHMNLVLVSPKHDRTRIVRRDGPNRISHVPPPILPSTQRKRRRTGQSITSAELVTLGLFHSVTSASMSTAACWST